ncbi:MAG: metallophosphoesterase, partial [Planctomycetota bacterium]
MRILVVTLFLTTIASMHVGWWWWTDRRLRGGESRPNWVKWLRVGVAVFAAAQVVVIAILLSGHRPALPLSMAYLWLLILMPLSIIAIAIKTLVAGAFTLATKFGVTSPSESSTEGETWPTRRSVLAAAVAAPPVLTLAGAGIGYSELDDFIIQRETLTLPNLPPALRGMTIAHVSDTHVGAFTKGRVLTKLVDAVNGLDADLVLFTGDLVNRKVSDVPAAGDMMNGMRGKHGVYIVEGNHDLFDGVDTFHRACEKAGLDLIANASRQLSINGYPVD